MPKYMTKEQIAEYEYLIKEKTNGRLLTADGIEFICAAHNYDAEAIGKHFLELLPALAGVREQDPAVAVPDYIAKITATLGKPINKSDVRTIDRGVPHERPKCLTPGTMAVYTFIYKGEFLKIGIAGSNSEARYTSQHYSANSAPSTLAKSILADSQMQELGLDASNIGKWIQSNCRRIDFELPDTLSIFARDLIEKMLHYKYEPRYEGFASQRKPR